MLCRYLIYFSHYMPSVDGYISLFLKVRDTEQKNSVATVNIYNAIIQFKHSIRITYVIRPGYITTEPV
jgi:hypothetical protein